MTVLERMNHLPDTTRGDPRPVARVSRVRRLAVRLVSVLAIVGLAGLAGGFALFVRDVLQPQGPPATRADGIVVLTGGAQRIADAIELLAEGRGRRLLISGVNVRVTRDEMIRTSPEHRAWFECCIDLDYRARNTVGNAIETRRWLREHSYRSVLVVTSAYHMPRSLVELSHALPGIRFIAHPVGRDAVPSDWWRDLPTLRLLGVEYVKYVVASVRTRLEGDPEQSRFAVVIGGRKPTTGAPLGL